MVDTWSQDFEGGSDGTTITSANSGTGGRKPVDVVLGTGSTGAYESTSPIAGSLSAKLNGPSGQAAYVNAGSVATQGGFRATHRFAAAPNQNTAVHIVRGSTKVGQVQLLANGKLRFENSNSSEFHDTPSALSFPVTVVLNLAFDTGTDATDGRLKFSARSTGGAYLGGESAPHEMGATNAGAGITSSFFQAGKANASTDTQDYYVDDEYGLTGAYSFAGPDADPIADAGPAQVDVEPGDLVTLDGTGSVSPGGGALTYAWTQTAGAAVVLDDDTAAEPTFTAPGTVAGDTLEFELVVTAGGIDSTPATVTVEVLPVTEFAAVGGSLVPLVPFTA